MDTVDRIFDLVDQQYKEQRDFARAIGVTPSIVSEWRRRKSASFHKRLPQIAATLGTTAEYLLTGQEPVSAATAPEHTAVPEPSARPPLAPEDRELLQLIHDKPGLRIMFDASKKATNEDILKAVEIIKAFYGIKEDD
ncbi:MAG: helix-turn-helix domain-containing protein [Clostridiales bacterium]|nr:helix-turn-helix domain-containing protein [Clostridiales bacterium]MCI7712820.1 helix-turn-helix domain-containing protein [Clostridiales bacterium]